MQKICINILVLLLMISQHIFAGSSQITPKLHICSVASQQTQGLTQLLDSCQLNGINVKILGYGQPFNKPADKVRYFYQYLQQLPDEDIVMFVDGYDVLILADKAEILDKFQKMDTPFVISVERYCYPFSHLSHKFPKGSTSYRFINSGSFIGYVSAVKDVFKDVIRYKDQLNDQGAFYLDFFAKPEKYYFDSKCELFMPLAGMVDAEAIIDKENFRVKCMETGTTPCVIHGNGGSRPLYQKIYDELFEEQ